MARRQNRHPPHPFNWNFSEKSTSGAAETASLAIFAEQKSHEMTDIKGRISPNTVSHFNRASNHNEMVLTPESNKTVSHFNRASNHNVQAGDKATRRTVSHFNRASNHNVLKMRLPFMGLFLISIEHQITTPIFSSCVQLLLFLISIEHQITTIVPFLITSSALFLISIEHQITTGPALRYFRHRLFLISIEHQITT